MLVGIPTLRLRGDYLAIVTLGFGEIVPIIARNWTGLTNGAAGMNGVQAPKLFGHSFGVNAIPYYYVAIGLVVLLIFVSSRLRDSRIGRAWMAIREDEIAASTMGVNLVNLKLLAFGIGAGFAGFTGVFYVAKLQTATPEMFGFPVSTMVLVMVVLGGMGSVWGVVLGAAILQLLQSWWLMSLTGWVHQLGNLTGIEWLTTVDLVQSIELIFGIILVLMMLFRREGLIPARGLTPALSIEQQRAEVRRGGFVGLDRIPRWEAGQGNALEIRGLTVKFGGLVESDSCIVKFYGEEIRGLKPHEVLQRGVARTFQNIRLFLNLTVLENVLVGQHSRLRTGPFGAVVRPPNSRAEEEGARKWGMDIIGLFGNRLTPRKDQTVGGLSYANRRRTEIARALASRPKILLLDEPTAGMNPAETLELAEQIKSLHEMGLTILLIEHKLDVVTTLAETVVVLDHGDKIAEGKPAEVRRNEEVLTAYLGRAARAEVEAANVA
jgi:branched-chain amino acid transport system permease protein